MGFSRENASMINDKAADKYYAWLRPPIATAGETNIAIWFFVDRYYNSYLSILPEILSGAIYGTGSIVLAIWYGGLKPTNSLRILGFGQIVAIVLLALTLLAAVEVINGEHSWYAYRILYTNMYLYS